MSGRVLVRQLMPDNALTLTDIAGDELTARPCTSNACHSLHLSVTHDFLEFEREEVVKIRDYLTQWLDTQS